MKSNALSAYKERAKSTCLTQRRVKRNKTKDLTNCRSIDLMSYYNKSVVGQDDELSLTETKFTSKKAKRSRVPDFLNMMHCQAKFIESILA